MKKRRLFIALFTIGLFYFYSQIFSFSNSRTFQIKRTFDPTLSITRTSLILTPKSTIDAFSTMELTDVPSFSLEGKDGFLFQWNTKSFSLIMQF